MLGWQQREAGAARVASEAAEASQAALVVRRRLSGVGRSAQAMAGGRPPARGGSRGAPESRHGGDRNVGDGGACHKACRG